LRWPAQLVGVSPFLTQTTRNSCLSPFLLFVRPRGALPQ
jgi:hypothetical protein